MSRLMPKALIRYLLADPITLTPTPAEKLDLSCPRKLKNKKETKEFFLKIVHLAHQNFQNKIIVTDNFETTLNKVILKLLKKNFSLVLYGKKIDTNGLI